MKIENVKKATDKIKELKELDEAITEAQAMLVKVQDGGEGILFRQYSDGSGAFDVPYVFVDGTYPTEMYARIAENIIKEFKALRDVIVKEIEVL